jgi:hypothetical protein
MKDTRIRSPRQEHGIRDAYYSMLPDSKPHPVMQCLCGFYPEKICDSWKEAGEALDLHITTSITKDAVRVAQLHADKARGKAAG